MTAEPHKTGADLPRPFFARTYAALAPRMDAGGLAVLRDELLAALTGTVVEVGMNFTHYPDSVSAGRLRPTFSAGLSARDQGDSRGKPTRW